jgi:hypothetical protein
MTIDAGQFRAEILIPALGILHQVAIEPVPLAQDLLMATAATETLLGTWLAQQAGGPAQNIFEMEMIGFGDVWTELLKPKYVAVLRAFRADPGWTPRTALQYSVGDLMLATLYARIFYWLKPFAMPTVRSFQALWDPYKRYFNTEAGATTEDEFRTRVNLCCDFKI